MFPPIYLSQFTVKLGKLAATSVDAMDCSSKSAAFEIRRLKRYLVLTLPFWRSHPRLYASPFPAASNCRIGTMPRCPASAKLHQPPLREEAVEQAPRKRALIGPTRRDWVLSISIAAVFFIWLFWYISQIDFP